MRSHAARQLLKGRRSTLSSSNPLTVVMAPHPEHPEIPTIIATTEAYPESQESNAADLPNDDKHFVSSSPSSLSILSIPSIPEQQPGNDQTSQTEQLKTTTLRTPLQLCCDSHSSNIAHSRSEGVLRTGSSISLHRPAVKHRLSEPISSSCSQLELPPREHSPQLYTAFIKADPTSSDTNHKKVIHHNTNPHNSNCTTMQYYSHPTVSMRHSMSQEYYHQQRKYGYGHQLICRSPSHSYGSSNCSPNDYVVVPEVPQNSHFDHEADLPPPTIVCNCIENQCPHCGLVRGVSIPHHQPGTVYVPAVTYATHQRQISMLTTSSSPSNQRSEKGPNASKEFGVMSKLNTNQLPSAAAFQGEELMNADKNDSESEHCSSTNDDQETNQAAVYTKDKKSQNKPANSGSMRPLESSNCQSKNQTVTKQRPQSATTGAGDAATTTNNKHNLHASADVLTENHCKNIT